MTLLKKLSIAAASSAAAFLALASFATDAAQAALFKYSFSSEEANGYFIYDDSAQGTEDSSISTIYYDAVKEYKVDLGDGEVYEGTTGNAVVFLVRQGQDGITAPETDDFLLEVRASQREPESQYSFVTYFHYPKGTFEESRELPTSVPSTATVDVYPNVDFPTTLGETAFSGTVQTRIEKIPEPALIFGLLQVSAWLILCRRRLEHPSRSRLHRIV
ncbi:MAG: hypothetical protein HC862_04355 [Scytonema sp. RU_4_4]|nr:hypothetical protein [Scytonema sp. RU_4_4]